MPLRCITVDDYQSFLNITRAKLERQGIAVVGVASRSADGLQGGLARTGHLPLLRIVRTILEWVI